MFAIGAATDDAVSYCLHGGLQGGSQSVTNRTSQTGGYRLLDRGSR